MIRLIQIVLFCLGLASCKKEKLVEKESELQYNFIVAGHVYGKPGTSELGLYKPFKSAINSGLGDFLVLNGDIVKDSDSTSWDSIDSDIDSLNMKTYFVAGNHDISNITLYESRYGPTNYSWKHNNDLFITLDGNIDNWNIQDEQLSFLKETIAQKATENILIHIFCHQLIWWERERYPDIYPNSTFGKAQELNFWKELKPYFDSLQNQVFLYSGDIGANSQSPDYFFEQSKNLHILASGMGEGKGDNYLKVNVYDNKIIFSFIPLFDSDRLVVFQVVR